MLRTILTILLLYFSIHSFGQSMRPVENLINTNDPAWPLVRDWIAAAKNKVEVLPCDSAKARTALYMTQVTTRSPMGAIVYSTGGIMVDDGWIRILGSGSTRLPRSLPQWNEGKSLTINGKPLFYLIADDVVGGYYAINGGGLGKDAGKIYYLAPDTLEWEAMGWTYTEFLRFCFSGDLDRFYASLRWKDWRNDVTGISGDQTFNFFPALYTKEGKDFSKSSRHPIPVDEQYRYTLDMKKQLGIK